MIWRSKSSVVREDKAAKGKEATAEATEAEIYANAAPAQMCVRSKSTSMSKFLPGGK